MLLDDISVLGDDLLLIAEEFGDWEDARRRIDLLGIDRTGRLVVIELKRTDDGGFMDLQAVRYAAMVSAMDFDQVAQAYARHKKGAVTVEEARAALLDFIDADRSDEGAPVIGTDVRIVLVAADFGRELTSAVLWLNDHDLDIRCVRIVPYDLDGRVLVDVQQVIPLPEAAEYQVRLRQKEQQRERARRDGRDFTRYHIVVDEVEQPASNKRRSILAMVVELHRRGVPMRQVASVLPSTHLRSFPGVLQEPEEISASFSPGKDPGRWFLEQPLHEDDHTFVVSKMWGHGMEAVLTGLVEAFPHAGVTFRRAED